MALPVHETKGLEKAQPVADRRERGTLLMSPGFCCKKNLGDGPVAFLGAKTECRRARSRDRAACPGAQWA